MPLLASTLVVAAALAIAATLGACSSPTSSGETVYLEGDLTAAGSVSHVVAVTSSGVTTITVLDLKKLIWDVTLGDCFVLSDPGSMPADSVLSYSVRLELPS